MHRQRGKDRNSIIPPNRSIYPLAIGTKPKAYGFCKITRTLKTIFNSKYQKKSAKSKSINLQ